MTAVLLYTTGGTFDALLEGDTAMGPPAAPGLLEGARVTVDVRCIELMRKDSSLIDEADREAICKAVRETPARRIVIVHGTDSLVETLDALSAIPGKVVVLTGSFAPAHQPTSDAAFNLGAAIAAVQLLPEGAYAVIGGEVYAAGTVAKDRPANRFRRIPG